MRLQANPYGISERIDELIANLEEMEKVKLEGESEVELSSARFVTPLSILPLAVYANNNGMRITCMEEDPNVCSYLETIGFHEGVTDVRSEKRYLPITKLPPTEDNPVLGRYENRIIAELGGNIHFTNALKHLTSELVNNVNEHAEIDHYWMLAQYYEKTCKTCEIVIADCGKGYRASYEGTQYEVSNDRDAIINALEGKSSKAESRGRGIPSVENLFVNGYGGKLVIMSGSSLIYYKQKVRKELTLNAYWQGAWVAINFNLKDVNIYNYL